MKTVRNQRKVQTIAAPQGSVDDIVMPIHFRRTGVGQMRE